MRLLLTSNFPRPGNHDAAAVLRSWGEREPFQWIGLDADRYEQCRGEFSAYGLELRVHSASLGSPSRLFLAGGPPTQLFAAFAPALAATVDDSCMLAAASGGAMLCTSNLSLFRLKDVSATQAFNERDQYRGLGYCSFELLPHFDKHPKAFIDEVRRYSELVAGDIWCLPDGAAIAWSESGAHPIGTARCMRKGEFVLP
jgi:hypothetical protein